MSHTPHTSPQDIESKKTPQQKESEGSYVDLVLSRIEQEGIKPHGRWYFILKNELLWSIGILTVLIGACAVSAALYNLSHTEFELYQVTHDSALLFFYDMMPFVWIFGLLIFIGIGYIQIRHTKKGYKYPLYILVGGMLLISIALGVMLHSIDIGKRTEEVFGRYIPFHRSGEMIRQDRWINAPKGIVAGEVILVDTQMFAVKDFKGEQWLIATEFLGPRDMFLVATGTKVRIVTL
ncbi:MAG: hypothetical protein RIQ72_540, partial [Candidatus Parcubacteria bacterium]